MKKFPLLLRPLKITKSCLPLEEKVSADRLTDDGNAKNPPPYGGGENSVVFQETTASYWSRLRTELLFWFACASMD